MRGYKQKNMACNTFSHIGADGEKVYKPKKKYDNEAEAQEAAYKINIAEKTITKVAAYKCWTCGKWHIGRTFHKLTTDDKEKYKKQHEENNRIKRIKGI